MSALNALVDVRPLRDAPFRRLWLGSTGSQLGTQMTAAAVMLQLWDDTGSTTWTGAVGIAHVVPLVVVGMLAGSFADRHDRRRIVLGASVAQLVVSAALAAQALAGGLPPVWLLALVALQTTAGSVGGPASRTFAPALLGPDRLAAGFALMGMSFQLAVLLGPALAGLVAGVWGVGVCYLVDTVSFLGVLYAVWRLPALRAERTDAPTRGTWATGVHDAVDGLRYVARQPLVRAAFVVDLAATVFAMPISLFAALNDERFGGAPQTFGLFAAALAGGGIVANLLSGTFTRRGRPGATMLVGATCWGVALAAAGAVQSGWATLLFLALAGASDTVSVVSRGTLVQTVTPDAYRGRVAAAELVVGAGGPDVGNVRGGIVAGLTSPTVALVSGGLACVVVVGALATRVRALRTYRVPGRAPVDVPAEAASA
ncbi:MFS transporter [Luteimicrobium sp. DT211]|uniref:MFS transporter n=1 Tax=Luteimicrobium sp. DT211 TaxID=3393412 RepID=UPI003CF6F9DE